MFLKTVQALPKGPWGPAGRMRWVALGVALLLATGSGIALAYGGAADELPSGVALRVGDREVTVSQLDDRVATLEALYGVVPPADDDPAAADFRRDSAKSYVVGFVVEQEAERREIVIPEKKARAELNKIIEDRLAGDREAFARFLGDAGLTESTILDEIRRTLATNALYEQVIADVPDATLKQARAEFQERRAEMTTPEERAISNIVVASEDDAEAVLAELEDGASFDEVAAVSSLDTSTKDKGGALGTLAFNDLDPHYAGAAFTAKKGDAFGPVQSEFGWNVGIVTDVKAGEPLSFAQVKATLLAALTSRAQSEVWGEFLADLLDDADVVYVDDYRPSEPTSPPSQNPTDPDAPAVEED